MGKILTAFMEEKNVKWIELASGLLVVGSATALVVSFCDSMHAFMKLVLLIATTIVQFGVGRYTRKQWKLPHTSMALDLMVTLIAPLNLMAVGVIDMGFTAIHYGAVIFVLITMGVILYRLGREALPRFEPETAALLLPPLVLVLANHQIPETTWGRLLCGFWISTSYVVILTRPILSSWSLLQEENDWIDRAILLGLASFSWCLSAARLTVLLQLYPVAMIPLSPAIVLTAAPMLMMGLSLRRFHNQDLRARLWGGWMVLVSFLLVAISYFTCWPEWPVLTLISLIACIICVLVSWKGRSGEALWSAQGLLIVTIMATGAWIISANDTPIWDQMENFPIPIMTLRPLSTAALCLAVASLTLSLVKGIAFFRILMSFPAKVMSPEWAKLAATSGPVLLAGLVLYAAAGLLVAQWNPTIESDPNSQFYLGKSLDPTAGV